jgi:hypothetical protein
MPRSPYAAQSTGMVGDGKDLDRQMSARFVFGDLTASKERRENVLSLPAAFLAG